MNELLKALEAEADATQDSLRGLSVMPDVRPEVIESHLRERYDFQAPVDADALISDVVEMLRSWTVHVTHPRYFGLFPTVHPISVVADALVALFNPQLAVWRHAPAANEMERHVLRFLQRKLGYDPDATAAHFTSGGQEANLTAVTVALTHLFPEFGDRGLRGLERQPVFYLSEEGHHSFHKIAHGTGLGRSALRIIPTDSNMRIDPVALRDRVTTDRADGFAPAMVVGMGGTTAAGIIDPLQELASIARDNELWFHVDAAWGATALLSDKLRWSLDGIERADSVTWDAHKWLSVPIGAGMFFCRWPDTVEKSFAASASYVPPAEEGRWDSYVTSVQWSRRFIGLKLFMALAERGAGGYAAHIERQAAIADTLREGLVVAGWRVVNDTPLPTVCFTNERIQAERPSASEVVERVNESGQAWISEVILPVIGPALRATITSYRTTEADLEVLLRELDRALGVEPVV